MAEAFSGQTIEAWRNPSGNITAHDVAFVQSGLTVEGAHYHPRLRGLSDEELGQAIDGVYGAAVWGDEYAQKMIEDSARLIVERAGACALAIDPVDDDLIEYIQEDLYINSRANAPIPEAATESFLDTIDLHDVDEATLAEAGIIELEVGDIHIDTKDI